MRQLSIQGLTIVLACLFFPSTSNADLILQMNGGEAVVFDSIGNRYWYANLDDFNVATYSEQKAAIASLNSTTYFGQDSWHMVNSSEMQTLFSNYTYDQIAGVFGFAFTNGSTWTSYSGRIDESLSSGTHRWLVFDHYPPNWSVGYIDSLSDSTTGVNVSAWIATNQITAVPEPSSMMMCGLITVGIVWRRRVAKLACRP